MSGARVERRLAAILAADVVGYSRLMGQDEAGTLARLRALRDERIAPKIAEHKGRIVKTTGDGILIEFASVVEAVACAVAVQREMAQHNVSIPQDQRIEFRVGINSGDVLVEGDDIHGDGVNIAARLEALAEPGGICISGMVHDQVQGRLEVRFENTGDQSLKNIARPVRVYRVQFDEAAAVTATPVPATLTLMLPDKPSIAVLPFQNMSGDPEQDYFVDGMVEEIITALSRIRWLFVIARNPSFTYKDQAVDVKQVGRELGVRYVMEGSVRKAANRVRITGQLIDGETGAHLWADRFDGSLEDVFELQDEVASTVAGIIEPTLQSAETARSERRPTAQLTAYDLYLRALAHSLSYEKDQFTRALELLAQAIERDPNYGPALALAAHCHKGFEVMSWTQDRERVRHTSLNLARQALRFGPDDPDVLALAAFTLGYFGEDIDVAIGLIDRCLALNPSSARGWHWSGLLRVFAGQPDLALEHFRIYLRLNPRDRLVSYLNGIGEANFFSRRFDEAAANLLASLERAPGFPITYRVLASCYAHMGRLDDAREIVSRLRAIAPAIMEPGIRYRDRELRELFLSGLQLAAREAS